MRLVQIEDVLEIITVFSARLYGSRSRKNKQMLHDVAPAVLRRQADDAPGA